MDKKVVLRKAQSVAGGSRIYFNRQRHHLSGEGLGFLIGLGFCAVVRWLGDGMRVVSSAAAVQVPCAGCSKIAGLAGIAAAG